LRREKKYKKTTSSLGYEIQKIEDIIDYSKEELYNNNNIIEPKDPITDYG